MKKYLVPRLMLSICVLIETQNVSGSPKKRGFKNKSPSGKVIARNIKLKKLLRILFELTFENIFLFLILFPRCFPGQALWGP